MNSIQDSIQQKILRRFVLILSFSVLPWLSAHAQNTKPIWIEAENSATINVKSSDKLKIQTSGWGNKQFLSGESWFQISAEENDVEANVPDEGILLSYKIDAPRQATYEIWNRIGYEFVRSPFDWRVDNGEWHSVSPQELTTDLMELGFFNEVAWLQLGNQNLNAGAHLLEIRLPKAKDDKGKFARILYASDAIVLSDGAFHPNGAHKPDENKPSAEDIAAAQKVFALPAAKSGERGEAKLEGDWEIARDDEQMPRETGEPIGELPQHAFWSAIKVPSDKNVSRPDLVFAHRLWYRTRVSVPQSEIGRSFILTFPMNSLNTTVYVNGTLCGFSNAPLTRADIDVTKGIKAGTNEIWVGIRDAWYGRNYNPDEPLKLRRTFNTPIKFFGDGFQDLAYPIWNNSQSGILETPFLTSVGSTYASDVFVQPSVAKKQLNAQITLQNSSNQSANGTVEWAAIDDKSGQVAKTSAAQPFALAAGATSTLNVAADWTNAKLWWPNDPNLYRLRTIIKIGGQVTDVQETSFGFREWSARGVDFLLNGVRWQQWADLTPQKASSPEEFLKIYRDTNQRTFRLMMPGQGAGNWRYLGMALPEVLNFFDRNGVVIRRNSLVDGEAIGYAFSEGDAALKKKFGTEMKVQLMKNWREQTLAQVRNERNHPSINIWTIENEFAYINLINLLGNSPLMDEYEREIAKISDAVMNVDPTRLVMIDGGGATKFQNLPIHGNHYVFDAKDTRYPNLAYEKNPNGGSRGRWIWDEKRPRFIGEDFFATGINPADYAIWGGEASFLSKSAARPAGDWVFRMLSEGYRWSGQSAWQFWSGTGEVLDPWKTAFAWRAVFARQYDWSFASGQKVKRTWGIFNDTQFAEPLLFKRTLLLNNKVAWSQTSTHKVAPGQNEKFDEIVPMPNVTTRQEGQLVLMLSVGDKEIFRDSKAVSLLPSLIAPPSKLAPKAQRSAQKTSLQVLAQQNPALANAKNLLVFDPNGSTLAFLKAAKIAFTPLNSLENLPISGQVLVIGHDALNISESTSSRLAAYAAGGRRVLVLDQKNPLKYQGLPAEIELVNSDAAAGSIGFIEDASHPIFRGLKSKDFQSWAPDGNLYRDAYVKPARGAKSLLQVGPRLQNSAVVEVPVGDGLMLLSQLSIGEKVADNIVAQQLLVNLLNYGASYKMELRPVAVALGNDTQLAKTLDAIGLQYGKANSALDAISSAKTQLAIIEATPQNLQVLAANLPKIKAFNARGGYIIFHGLTPEGLESYNKIVGFDHMIRPMRRERISLAAPRDPLTAGLTLGDVVLLSGERIFGWTSDEYVASDMFSYVVDYEDVASFGKSSNGLYENAVNGFFQSDGWKLINNFKAPENGALEIPVEFPKPVTINQFTWVGNTLYNPQTKVGLNFDGKNQLAFEVKPDAEAQTFDIKPPQTGKTVTLQILAWEDNPGKSQTIGIDNFSLKAQRSPEFYQNVKPMLNVGGLMHYPRGKGGLVLANLLFKDNETVPINVTKKRNIFAAILRNLRAPFASSKTVIAGAGLQYVPIDIHNQATQYRNDKGWFGDKNFTFNGLPTGKQNFAGVTYDIYDFPTSPVPTAIMLGGNGIPNNPPQEVKDIPINRKADALFFLQAARIDQRRNNNELRDNKKLEMARYVIHYSDGKEEILPVYAEIDVENYQQEGAPRPIAGAQIAWTKPYAGTNFSAVAYAQQWNNPRPDVEIKSVDFQYGADRRGVPVLLAITAANASK